jgi:hypothetical protein
MNKKEDDDAVSFACGFEQFTIGTDDGGVFYDVFEWLSPDKTQVGCTCRDIQYAQFIAASLNHCAAFSPMIDL